jgi:hypothetical protein
MCALATVLPLGVGERRRISRMSALSMPSRPALHALPVTVERG